MGEPARVLALPTLLCADDVQRQLRCSRAEAYAHLRACAAAGDSAVAESLRTMRAPLGLGSRYV